MLNVLPELMKQWWFLALMALLVGSVIFLIYNEIKLRKIRRELKAMHGSLTEEEYNKLQIVREVESHIVNHILPNVLKGVDKDKVAPIGPVKRAVIDDVYKMLRKHICETYEYPPK